MLINIDWLGIGCVLGPKDSNTDLPVRVMAAFREYHDQLERKITDLLSQHMTLFHEPKLKCPYCGATKE